ncbi:MAG: PH domain-containing protein [Emticicia sp.]|nr:PH domain-containing protein [Emticicia sp.]
MKKYKSKISYWLFVPVLLLFLYVLVLMVFEKDWLGGIVILSVILLIFSIILKTYYQIEGSTLKIVSGFIVNKEIQIKNIRKIVKTRSLLSSPALSVTNRIEVFYDKYDTIIISPEEQEAFISALKSFNHEIEIKL